MGDSTQRILLPPSQGSFASPTPSGLTPNTRSEAEFAFMLNASQQTDSAAPVIDEAGDGLTEAQRAYRRPAGPIRASSTNYEKALREVRGQASASSNLTDDTTAAEDITDTAKVQSPASASIPFPPPGQGVVPSYSGVSTGQANVVKKARDRGLSLGQLGRQQSWNEQDMKHVLQGKLMAQIDGAAGYDSGNEGGPAERS
ncbi:hypothetical protein N0V90_011531 [Kalmusia sp. IMI 367209]|nr:hypothetical protein N0V90_011531 [Kalmusia sp. IMI 367209]